MGPLRRAGGTCVSEAAPGLASCYARCSSWRGGSLQAVLPRGGAALERDSTADAGTADGPQPLSPVYQLWEILRALRQPASRRKEESRLFQLLFPQLYTWARKRGQAHHDAEDVASYILSAIFQSFNQCRGLDSQDPGCGMAETFNWYRRVRETRYVDWLRRQGAHGSQAGRVLEQQSASEEPAAVPAEASESLEARQLAVDAARQCIREVIRSRQPDALYQQARELEVGLTLSEIDRQLHVFERVRWRGERTYEVGISLGESGARKQIQDRVSKWVERGRKALLVGARCALMRAEYLAVREELELLASKLTEPLKRRKA